MSFDTLVTNPGRLRILTTLAVEESQDFVGLRKKTQLTDGNLSSHARRLREAGLVLVEKTFRNGKPVTSFTLTQQGRQALESHVRKLLAAISQRRMTSASSATESVEVTVAADISREKSNGHHAPEPVMPLRSFARQVVHVSVHPELDEDDLPPDDLATSRTPRVVRTVVRGISRPVMMERPASLRPAEQQMIPQPAISPSQATVAAATASASPPTAPPAASILEISQPAPASQPDVIAIPQPEEPSDWVD